MSDLAQLGKPTTSRRVRRGSLILLAAIATAAVFASVLDATGVTMLRGLPAIVVYGLTESGGPRFVPLVLVVALAVWATDPSLAPSRRRRPAGIALLLLLITLPAAAILNERILKPAVAAPRPSHRRLAAAGIIPNLDAFYRLDHREREPWLRGRLSEAANATAIASLELHPVVLRHWAHETGYSFPSSHAMNAFAAATLLLDGALVNATPRRRRVAGIMLGWAIGVCLSRVLLLVHRPLDVAAGAAAGAGLGALLLLPWWKWSLGRDQKST